MTTMRGREREMSGQPMPELSIATAFFDQFPPLENTEAWEGGQWCARHWAPAAFIGADGTGAAIELAKIWRAEMAPKGSYSPAAMKRKLAAAGNICCTLGDERMWKLWGRWPPVQQAGEEGE